MNETDLIVSSRGHRFAAAGVEAALRSDPLIAHAAAFGTGHSYTTALIALDPAMARDWAVEQGRPSADLALLAHDPELIQTVSLVIAYANRDLPAEQRVRAFTVVGEEWVPGSALLSFEGAPERAQLAQRYAADLDAMYADDPYVAPAPLATPDPTIPPFVTEVHTAPPKWTGPSGNADGHHGIEAQRPAADTELVDPTPSFSAVLKPQRPLAKKDPHLSSNQPEGPQGQPAPTSPPPSNPPTAQQPASPQQSMQFSDDAYYGSGGQGGNNDGWDPDWNEQQPPARRWWWAVLVALVVVAAGAVIAKTVSNSNSSNSDDTSITEPYDTTMDTEFMEDPDAVDTTPIDTEAPTSTVAADPLLIVAERSANLTTFLTAVKAAGLDTDLGAAGPFTIFAPTDDAFNKVPPELLSAILADPTVLAKVLRHHVVAGSINVENLTEGTLTALDGTTITIATATEITLDGTTRPVDTDIPASNGVIHTIDSVLLPPDVDPATLVTTTTTLPAKLLYAIYFTTSPTGITTEGKDEVAAAAEAIKALPEGSTVTVVGYTLKSGTAGHQRYLARLRASTVIKELKKAGATNVSYVIRSVIGLPLSGDKALARRAEIQMPGYSADGTTTTAAPTTTMEP